MRLNKTIYIFFATAVVFAYTQKADAKNEIYNWQTKTFKRLGVAFKEELARPTNPEPVPEENNDLFLWQLKDYKTIEAKEKGEVTEILNWDPVPEEIGAPQEMQEPTK